MEKPTLSPQSNRLLDICQGVLDGTNKPDELSELLEEMQTGLEKARNDFVEQVQKQGETYIEKMQLEMDMVLASFENYQAGLDHISGFFHNNNPQQIEDGMEMIIRATNEILDTLTVYEAKSLQIGPTSFPILNMLILLTDGFKANTVSEDEFRFMIYNAGLFFQKLVDEAENYKGDEGREAIEMLKEGYLKFLDGLDKMDEAAKIRNDMMLDDGLKLIDESQEIIKRGYARFNDQILFEGPTESPVTNLLINTLKMVKDGHAPKELLAENLETYQEHLDTMRADFEGASFATRDQENAEMDKEIEDTLKALDLADEACDMLRTFIQTGNMAVTDPAVEKLKESCVLLKRAKEAFDDMGERESKIACVRCGHLNEPTNNNCAKCKAVLTKIPGQETGSFTMGEGGQMGTGEEDELVMTQALVDLFQAAEKFITGKSDFAEFEAVLDRMENDVNNSIETVNRNPILNLDAIPEEQRSTASEYKTMAEEATALFHEGAEEFLDGLNQLRQTSEDTDMTNLREGIKTVLEAAKKLQQVQRITEKVEKKLAELAVGTVDVQAVAAAAAVSIGDTSEDAGMGETADGEASAEGEEEGADEDSFISSSGSGI